MRRRGLEAARCSGRGLMQGGGGGGGAVVTLGTFDGVHRGHQAVLAEVLRRTRASGRTSVLVTFDPHPLAVVNPAATPKLLSLPEEKRERVTAQGIERFVLMPFTQEVAQLDAAAFCHRLRDELGMRELVMEIGRASCRE